MIIHSTRNVHYRSKVWQRCRTWNPNHCLWAGNDLNPWLSLRSVVFWSTCLCWRWYCSCITSASLKTSSRCNYLHWVKSWGFKGMDELVHLDPHFAIKSSGRAQPVLGELRPSLGVKTYWALGRNESALWDHSFTLVCTDRCGDRLLEPAQADSSPCCMASDDGVADRVSLWSLIKKSESVTKENFAYCSYSFSLEVTVMQNNRDTH